MPSRPAQEQFPTGPGEKIITTTRWIEALSLRWFEPNTCHPKPQVRPGPVFPDAGPAACPGAVRQTVPRLPWASGGPDSGWSAARSGWVHGAAGPGQ